MAVVWPLAPHPTNKNELIVWDLAHDPAELATLDAATRAPAPVHARRRAARGRDAAADQDHPHQQVAGRHRQPEDAGRRRSSAGASTSTRRCAMPNAPPPSAARSTRCGREVFARAPAERRTRCRRRPVRRLRRQRRPAPAGAAARRCRPRRWRPSARPSTTPRLDELLFRYRARNFPGTLDADGAAALAAALPRAPARRRGRRAHAGGVSSSASTRWRRPPTNAATNARRSCWRRCTTTRKASPQTPDPTPEPAVSGRVLQQRLVGAAAGFGGTRGLALQRHLALAPGLEAGGLPHRVVPVRRPHAVAGARARRPAPACGR